jgi:hypothetical protein
MENLESFCFFFFFFFFFSLRHQLNSFQIKPLLLIILNCGYKRKAIEDKKKNRDKDKIWKSFVFFIKTIKCIDI